jgi:hypothetical protein
LLPASFFLGTHLAGSVTRIPSTMMWRLSAVNPVMT